MSKRELEAFVPRVACDGTIAPSEDMITLTIRCRPECADMLDEVKALLGVNNGEINQGDVLMRSLAFFIEKHEPGQKAARAHIRAGKRAAAAEKTLQKLQDGWDMNRGHPQALAINQRNSEKNAVTFDAEPAGDAADQFLGDAQSEGVHQSNNRRIPIPQARSPLRSKSCKHYAIR